LNEEAIDASVLFEIQVLGAGLCSQGFVLIRPPGFLFKASALLACLMMFWPWLIL